MRVWGVDAFAAGVVLSLRRDGAATLRVVPREGTPFDLMPEHAGGMVRLGRNEDWGAAVVTVEIESFVHPTVTVDVAWDGGRSERHVKESSASTWRRTSASASGPRPRTARGCRSCWCVTATPRSTALRPASSTATAPTRRRATRTGASTGGARCRRCSTAAWSSRVGHPRGGGEMGRRWWDDGHLAAKHTTFDDQAAVAEHLLDGRVRAVVTRGLSAGGLLQGALYGRHPGLFAGVIAEVPFVDVVSTDARPDLPAHGSGVARVGRPARA